jgi:hypothetical protein
MKNIPQKRIPFLEFAENQLPLPSSENRPIGVSGRRLTAG